MILYNLYDAGTVSLPAPPLLRIHHHLETLPSFPPIQEHHSQSSVHPILRNVWGLKIPTQNTSCYSRKELPDIKSLKKTYLWIWQTENGWVIKNFTHRLLKEYRKMSACYTSCLPGWQLKACWWLQPLSTLLALSQMGTVSSKSL